MGRALITAGLAQVVVGVLISLGDRLPLRLGRLPGDIRIEGKNGGGFYFPVVTCILISIVLSLLGWIAGKFR